MNQNLNNILQGARDIVSGKNPGISYKRQLNATARQMGRGDGSVARFEPVAPTGRMSGGPEVQNIERESPLVDLASAPSEAVLTEHTVDTNGDVVSRVVVAKAKRTYYLYEDGVVSQRKRDVPLLGSLRATTTDEAAVLFGGVK